MRWLLMGDDAGGFAERGSDVVEGVLEGDASCCDELSNLPVAPEVKLGAAPLG